MFVNFIQQSETLRRLLFNHHPEINEDNISLYSSAELQDLLSDVMVGDTFVSSSDISYDNGEFVFSEELQDGDANFTNLLNDFLQNDDVKNIVDVDGSGTLGIDEINDFLAAVEALDQNSEDISMNDMFSAIQSIENGTFADFFTEETDEVASENLLADAVNPNKNTDGTRKTGGKRNGGSSDDVDNSSSNEDYSTMPFEKLEPLKSTQEGVVKAAQEKLDAAYAGETDAIIDAQADYDDKKLAYEEALANDESVSAELKTQQEDNQTNIQNQKNTINDVKSNIDSKDNEIASKKSAISTGESTITGLKNAISKLESQTSEDSEIQDEITSQLNSAKDKLEAAEAKLETDKADLIQLEADKADLETKLQEEEANLTALEEERATIEASILLNCGEATKEALEAFKTAESNLDSVKATEIANAKSELASAQSKLDEINAAYNDKNVKHVEKEHAVNDFGNVEQLYKNMGLDEKGLNFEVFASAIEGYSNLTEEQRASGFLGIFDTTQGTNDDRYYLLDLNTFELVGQSELKTGSGNMDNIVTANKHNSHATLSGFEMVGAEYYSNSMEKRALRLIGLEEGINDNAMSKGTVVHYTVNNNTWGCKGFPPVKTNGRIDKEATYELMRELFPENAIIYTHPTDERYWDMSELYA